MISIISGTNRKDANAAKIAKIYARLLDKADASYQTIDLQDLPKDFIFSALYENSGKNGDFLDFQNKVDESDKLIFIISEYNGSYPGVLKAFIDGMRYPDTFKGKKAALVGLSAGSLGGAIAMSHFSDICQYLEINTLPIRPKLANIYEHLSGENLKHTKYMEQIEAQVKAFLAF